MPSSWSVVPGPREGNDANAEGYDENIHRSFFHVAFRRVSILHHLYNIGSAESQVSFSEDRSSTRHGDLARLSNKHLIDGAAIAQNQLHAREPRR